MILNLKITGAASVDAAPVIWYFGKFYTVIS